MLEFIVPALQNLLTIENLIWINLGVFIGSVFAAIPGLTVILCIILFLPFTYQMTAIPGMMFLLGIYCAGGYGGSVSAILINTPGTPHAAATMLDGYPLNQKGRPGWWPRWSRTDTSRWNNWYRSGRTDFLHNPQPHGTFPFARGHP